MCHDVWQRKFCTVRNAVANDQSTSMYAELHAHQTRMQAEREELQVINDLKSVTCKTRAKPVHPGVDVL
jgi:hypothetical protein